MQRPPPPPPQRPPNQFNAPPPLPPGWIEYRAQGGHPYWFNTVNQTTTWERPQVPAIPEPPQQQNTVTSTAKPKKSRVKIPGTTWLLVTTDDGVEFYYDKATKSSVWEMPKDLEEPIAALKKEQQEEAKRKQQQETLDNEPESKRQKVEEPATTETGESTELTEEDIMWQMENMDPDDLAALGYIPDDMDGNDESEQAKIEDQGQSSDTHDQDNQEPSSPQHHPEEAQTSEPLEAKKDDDDKLSDEEKIELFTQMLTEKDISPFATWEKELPKLIADPRYNLVQPHNKRKSLFNNYCRVLASEKKAVKEGTKSKKTPEEDYKNLLNQMVINKIYWDDFRRKAKNDPRFKAVRESKLRETLFKDHIKQLSSSPKSKGDNSSNKASTIGPTSSSVEDRYRDLLVEQKVHVGMRWRDAKRLLEHDDRYHDIESKTLREDLFRDYLDEIQQQQH